MDSTLTEKDLLPRDAVFGRHEPEGIGPTLAEEFEALDQEEGSPLELIGGWVLSMTPGDFGTGEAWGDLYAALRPLIKSRGWSMSQDSRHRLPNPPRTVVFPDIAVHTISPVPYLPGTKTIGRVPDLVVEFLSEKTHERDTAPHGAKFLAYQMSGVREYYYAWPDGHDAAAFALQNGVYLPLPRNAGGFFQSSLLGCGLRLVEAAIETA